MKTFLKLALVAALVGWNAFATAQQRWPEREVTLTVTVGPGGNIDLLIRKLAAHLQPRLGVPVTVRNRAGANGALGMGEVARSQPNGYTVVIASPSTLSLTPHMFEVNYSKADFDYVAGWTSQRFGLAVRADSRFRTLADLIDASKTQPINFGSASSLVTLMTFELGTLAKANFEMINYKSGAEVTTALLGDQIHAFILNPTDIIPHVASGKLRFLASVSAKRWPEYPSVPTLKEAGYDVQAGQFVSGLAVPKGTPKPAIERMEREVRALAADPAFQKEISDLGAEALFISGDDYRALIDRQHTWWYQQLVGAKLVNPGEAKKAP